MVNNYDPERTHAALHALIAAAGCIGVTAAQAATRFEQFSQATRPLLIRSQAELDELFGAGSIAFPGG